MKVHRYGERALLLEVGSHLVADYVTAIERKQWPEITDIVPAAETLLVHLRAAGDVGSVEFRLQDLEPETAAVVPYEELLIPIVYDGPDLAWIAEQTGQSVAEVVALHQAATYRVQFCGFAPGYGYLSGLDPLLQLPRRESPRTSVPAGAVAIADAYTAIYPSASPGGWHLIGSTDVVLFDPDLFDLGRSPALLRPGMRVRFVAQ